MTKALVTGATGFVGSVLCKELLDHGYEVRALYRNEQKLDTIKGLDLELFKGDICSPEDMQKACQGMDVVFHIAALFREAKHEDDVYRQVNIEGVRNVFDSAISAGVKKVIHCSTVGVHSHIPNPPADETEDYRPGDIYQETKCEGEKLALSYYNDGKMAGNVIRPAMIWGPGDTRTLKLFKGISKKRMPLIGTGKTFVHWILVNDLARAFRLAAEADVTGEVFIIAGREAVTMECLFKTIAEKIGASTSFLRLPALPIQLIGGLVEAVCIPFGVEPPIYRRRVDFFTKTRSFDSSKAKRLLGFEAASDFAGEVQSIADWYRTKGWI